MKTLTSKTKAWITPYSMIGPADLRTMKNADGLSFHSHDMTKAGWTYAGEAEITIQFVDEKTLVGNKVEALRNELAAVRAKAQADAIRIESKINDLLAIGYEPSPEGSQPAETMLVDGHEINLGAA